MPGNNPQQIETSCVIKSADETVNNSNALQNDDELLLAMLPNEKFHFSISLIASATSDTPNFAFAFTIPAGASIQWRWHGANSGSTWSDATIITSGGAVQILLDSPDNKLIEANGIVINGAIAGNLQLQWCQLVAHASDTKVLANSALIYRRLV